MTTTIDKFKDAYATLTVAVYEPLILRWVSGWSIKTSASLMAWRAQKSKHISMDKALATAHALGTKSTLSKLPGSMISDNKDVDPIPSQFEAGSVTGQAYQTGQAKPVTLKGFPNAVEYNGTVYPTGLNNVSFDASAANLQPKSGISRFFSWFAVADTANKGAKPSMPAMATPVAMNKQMGRVEADFDFFANQSELYTKLVKATKKGLQQGQDLHTQLMASLSTVHASQLYEFLPVGKIEEALSPIGVAHFYRQLYFNLDEGFGPIEHCFTVAPKESLEVVVSSTRRQIHEEIVEIGHEEISEQAIEERNMEEVSDKVSSMVQRDNAASMSMNGSYSTPVWSVGASAQASMAVSSQRSRETASKRLKDVTKRASERITKSYSIKTRDFEELTDSTLTRRVIKNDNDKPVNYALRRIFRRVRVKVQDLGPKAVWQLYLRNPGRGLAVSRFVHFREAAPLAVPDVPPGVPPRPEGGIESVSTSSGLLFDSGRGLYYVSVKITTNADRVITAVSIDSLTDLESNSKEDYAPSALNQHQWGANWDASSHTYSVNIAVVPGDSASVSVGLTYSWEPSQEVFDEWDAKRKQAIAELEEQHLIEQFERNKALITEKSKIRPRPANELRREERYEVMNRMVSHLFGGGDDPSEPTPLEIETFHRYFDIESMFITTHPSWWRPRFQPVGVLNGRPAYEITAESEPAKLGSSLGWQIQLDGDNRRNEFLNSPWLRVCLPIRGEREEEAVRWLAKHIEGDMGFDINSGPLKDLLDDLKQRRSDEEQLGQDGYDYVTVNSTIAAPDGALKPENVYPVVNEFDVTLPTEGFVYDEVLIKDEGSTDSGGG